MKYINNTVNFEKLPLDNAAKIYPAAMTKNWNAVFAVSVHIKEKVNHLVLQKAVNDLSKRFPSMYVALKKEFFWDCLVPATDFNIVEREHTCPCRPINIKDKTKPLFRVVYNEYEIRAEFFHSVTDGTGAMEYLKALLLRYFEIKEGVTPSDESIKNISQAVSPCEIKDDFQDIYEKGVGDTRKDTNAYQIPLEKEKDYLLKTDFFIDTNKLKALCKAKYNCTVTQYIAAAYALALLSQYDKNSKKPVKLSIPVNLRGFFSSKTLRNFASYITVNVTPETDFTFENVLVLIKKAMKERITKDNFFKAISQNISDERMIISKYSPNFIKRLVMRQAFRMYGEKKYTSTVTSIGNVVLPKELESRVNYFSAVLGETYLNPINCAVVGFKNTVCVTITSCSKNTAVQREFERLVKGISTMSQHAA